MRPQRGDRQHLARLRVENPGTRNVRLDDRLLMQQVDTAGELLARESLRQRAMRHPGAHRISSPRRDQAVGESGVNLLVQSEQFQGRHDTEVEDAASLEDGGGVQCHVQVRGGETIAAMLEPSCLDAFGNDQGDMRSVPSVGASGQAREPRSLKPVPHAFYFGFATGIEEQLQRMCHWESDLR